LSTEQGSFSFSFSLIFHIENFRKIKPKKEKLVKFTLDKNISKIFPISLSKNRIFFARKKINDVDQGFFIFSF